MSVPISASNSVTLSALTYEHPDGTRVFDGLDATFTVGRTGLVGRNGSGKSTLLQLISGNLTPARGSVTTSGRVAYLPQDITLDPAVSVSTVLGIDTVRTALRRIESGDGTGDDFDTVGDRWDVEERALATVHRLGLDRILHDESDFDRTVGTLSGGETVLLGLTARLLAEPGVLLLDEPTNNLDTAARERLQDALDRFPGTVIIAGHDRDLLDRMDTIAEMRDAVSACSAVASATTSRSSKPNRRRLRPRSGTRAAMFVGRLASSPPRMLHSIGERATARRCSRTSVSRRSS